MRSYSHETSDNRRDTHISVNRNISVIREKYKTHTHISKIKLTSKSNN